MHFPPELLLAPSTAPPREAPLPFAVAEFAQQEPFAALVQQLSSTRTWPPVGTRPAPIPEADALSAFGLMAGVGGSDALPGRSSPTAATVAPGTPSPEDVTAPKQPLNGSPMKLSGDDPSSAVAVEPASDATEADTLDADHGSSRAVAVAPDAPLRRGVPEVRPEPDWPPVAFPASAPARIQEASGQSAAADPAGQAPPDVAGDGEPSARTSGAPGGALQVPAHGELIAVPADAGAAMPPELSPVGATPVDSSATIAAVSHTAGPEKSRSRGQASFEQTLIGSNGSRGNVLPEAGRRELVLEQTIESRDHPTPRLEAQHDRSMSIAARAVGEATTQAPGASPVQPAGALVPGQADGAATLLAGGFQGSSSITPSQAPANVVQPWVNPILPGHFDSTPAERLVAAAPIEQLRLQLSKALGEGRAEIRMHLEPKELGQVDIQLEFKELKLTVKVTAERADTLDLLQRDARMLSRAFREAGLEVTDGDVTFTSGGHGNPGSRSFEQRGFTLARTVPDEVWPLASEPERMLHERVLWGRDGRLDVRA